MKTIILIAVFSTGFLFAQSVSDSSQIKNRKQEQKQIQQGQDNKQVGSKENPDNNKGNIKKKDVFIDKDGDGICDSRQGGMSFNKMRSRKGSGQKGTGGNGSGNGNQNGNGGK